MPIYSLGVLTTGVTSATAAWEIRASANVRARVYEIGVFAATAGAVTIGLGRPAAIGVTPTTPVDFLPEDPADVTVSGQIQSALAWTTGPTVPANFLRRVALPATIGAGVIWTFPRGLVIPASGSIVLWNLATNTGGVNAYASLEE